MGYKNILFRIKIFILEEYFPPFIIAVHYSLVIFPCLFPFILIYSCIKVKAFRIIWLLYYLWIYYDSTTLKTKGRKIHRLKYWTCSKYVRNFFPLRLIKTANLLPKSNYMFVCHPHGTFPHGVLGNFLTEMNKFTQLFPKIDVFLATLKFVFVLPVYREYAMGIGLCTSEEDNIKYLLNSKPSKAIGVFPGGAREFLLSRPGGEYKIFTQRRGFVKIALQTGVPMVPVFTFGEQNTQKVIEIKYRIVQYINRILHRYTRIRLALVLGRGILQNKFGLLPQRCPLTTVVGKPIRVPKVKEPSNELIDEYHKQFYEALHDLFETNKHMHDEAGSSARLIMI